MNFPFGTTHLEQMENLLFLGVPILKHIRVYLITVDIYLKLKTSCLEQCVFFRAVMPLKAANKKSKL